MQRANPLSPVKCPDDRREENAMWSSTAGGSPRNGEVNLESVYQANTVSNQDTESRGFGVILR